MSTEALKRYTVEEYLALERVAETKSEFFDGEIFAMAGGSEAHSHIAANLIRRVGNALDGRPCRVYTSDMRVKTPTGLYTYPDASVMCGKPEFEGDQRDILLNPVVIFEVLSPSTEAYDRGRKFQNYREIPSLMAYVLVSQDRKLMEQFARGAVGTWSYTAASTGSLEIPALEITLNVEEIYEHVEV
jgi:Uma2 family endonuclease